MLVLLAYARFAVAALLCTQGAPEILEYQHDLVDDLKELVENQQEEVDRNRQTGPTEFFNASLYQVSRVDSRERPARAALLHFGCRLRLFLSTRITYTYLLITTRTGCFGCSPQ